MTGVLRETEWAGGEMVGCQGSVCQGSGRLPNAGKGIGQCDEATWVCSPMLIEIRLLASHRDWEIGVLSLRVAWNKQ